MEPDSLLKLIDTLSLFQSLKGFQPKWNASNVSDPRYFAHVSIPKRVSAKVEQVTFLDLVFFTLFQSLKGFQPKWNDKFVEELGPKEPVSIPKRVSAKVER